MVSFLRVRKPGTGSCCDDDFLGIVDVGHLGADAQLNTALRQHDRSEVERHAVGLLDIVECADAARAVFARGDRNGAAGEKLGAFAGDRGHRRLGERARDALLLEGVDRGRQLLAGHGPADRGGVAERAVDGERIGDVERPGTPLPKPPTGVGTDARVVDAELLQDVAANFRDRHPQADLIEAADHQRVDDFALAAAAAPPAGVRRRRRRSTRRGTPRRCRAPAARRRPRRPSRSE